ncbi:MAG: Flp family type IVb pilin [Actinomycetota bacterium]
MASRLSLSDGERGATAVEYALMVALIAVVIIAAVTLLGTQISAMFSKIANKLV